MSFHQIVTYLRGPVLKFIFSYNYDSVEFKRYWCNVENFHICICQETWYQYDYYHRINGPAYIDIETIYYQYGRKHRENDLPAQETYYDGEYCDKYFFKGKLHRDNGPAIIYKGPGDSYEAYYKNGVKIKKYWC